METLQIKKSNAVKAYGKADAKTKALLEELFGKQALSQKITDRVKTFEDACEVLELDPDQALPYKSPGSKDDVAINSFAKLIIISKALNEGWKPDYSNSNEAKYYPWFEFSKSASAFRFYYTYFSNACAGAGSGVRLCFQNSELAEYAGKQFIDLYNDILN